MYYDSLKVAAPGNAEAAQKVVKLLEPSQAFGARRNSTVQEE
jgi:hypothetical protein